MADTPTRKKRSDDDLDTLSAVVPLLIQPDPTPAPVHDVAPDPSPASDVSSGSFDGGSSGGAGGGADW